MKYALISISLIALLFFCLSCNKEENPCREEQVGPNYELSDTARSHLNNYTLGANIIFKDISSNEDVVFNVESYVDTTESYLGYPTCEEDTTRQQGISGLSEYVIITLSNISLNKNILIYLRELPSIHQKIPEEMLIYYGETHNNSVGTNINSSESEGLLAHSFRIDGWPFSTLIDSLTINPKIFYEVLEANAVNPGFSQPFQPRLEIKYTKEEGIIYINDKINNRELVYDRKE